MFASAKKLDNLILFVDWNKKQLDGFVSDISNPLSFKNKFEAFGFHTQQVTGNSVEEILKAIKACDGVKNRPHAIILDTIKGSGVKEVEDTFSNHSMAVAGEVFDRWLKGLREELRVLEGEKLHA